jgi:hypothetical protein
MKAIFQSTLSLVLIAAAIAPPVSALDYPLSSSAIREAYFLGSGDPDKRAFFIEKYTKRYPIPKSGTYVALIRVETPYLLIAEHVSQQTSYHAPDAVQEFLGKPGICRVHVEVYWGYTAAPSPYGAQSMYPIDYTVRVKQNGKEIPIKSKWTRGLDSIASAPVEIGIELNDEYNAEDIQSGPATVEVVSPDGKVLSEEFDLDSLR